jgi:hypothetical protein
VKKARDLLLQFRRVARLTHGNGVFEKLPLDGCRQIIPLQKDRRPKALQDTPLFLREGHGFVAAWFFRCWPRRTSFAFHLAKALASGLLALRLFGVLATMHAIWDAEESAATGNGAPCRPRQSDLANQRVKAPNFFD